jgi:hypothetical protein
MKKENIKKSIVIFLLFLVSIYLINQCRKGALYAIDTLAKGIDPEYDLGENHRMIKPFGYIAKIDQYGEIELITNGGNISQFAFFNDWLIGRDEKGYFAINKKTDKRDYPIDSINSLEKTVGQSMQSIEWITNSRLMDPYVIKTKGTDLIIFIVNTVFGMFILLFFVFIFLYGKKKKYFQWNTPEVY